MSTTIVAPATPTGESAIAVVRLSGPECGRIAKEVFGKLPEPRKSVFAHYRDVDGLVTNVPGLVLVTFFADCVPVIFADPVSGSIGLAHAGWRGTVAGIAASTVTKMQEAFGAKPENILAGIGPSIGQCCYEVDDKVFESGKKYAGCFKAKENGRYMADLQAWNRLALLDAGLLPQNIYNAGICTQCSKELFFSYRAENGKTGRMGVTIWKK